MLIASEPSILNPVNFQNDKIETIKDNEPLNDLNEEIYINQSNNIYILAKYGQTISLPCNIVRQKHQDFSNVCLF